MEEEEDRDLDSVDLIGKLKKLKLEEALELTTTTENIINIPELDEPIPEVTIGRARRVISQKEDMKVQDLVLTDTPMSPEDWPQIGQVVELLDDDRVVIQPFWGKKTTTWKPAVRRPKGQKITFTVQKNVIWHYGFNLTPSGFLPKSIREMVEQYEEDNL
ncbi:uncharacterized protein LOC128556371 [Mercenaria mercenaria]|uniref:uncharacterized protein LOC128556371 n=1 Tax=Mercenaria mercenaria TaxID=6596 RepID=UPI00234E8EA4|nr:uncharacterized protein LOC128556371 [Mercenaria mercenaria]